MPSSPLQPAQSNYDARWFIWTIVFLVVTGISLVSYIALSDNGTNDVPTLPLSKSLDHTSAKQ